jgi:hypothetical protein
MDTPETPLTKEEYPLSGPDLCGKFDRGGGVSNEQNTFLVYSVRPIPSAWPAAPSAEQRSQLEITANAIAEQLEIWHDFSIVRAMTLRPLPLSGVPDDDRTSIGRRLPWFFINAATNGAIAIVGRESYVQTMLCVLRRPWCILELCCVNTSALRLLLRFATQAAEFDVDGYLPAVGLLSHELRMRECRFAVKSCPDGVPQKMVLKSLCLAAEESFNALWLRAIYETAFELKIAFSELGGMLRLHSTFLSRLPDERLSESVISYLGKHQA